MLQATEVQVEHKNGRTYFTFSGKLCDVECIGVLEEDLESLVGDGLRTSVSRQVIHRYNEEEGTTSFSIADRLSQTACQLLTEYIHAHLAECQTGHP